MPFLTLNKYRLSLSTEMRKAKYVASSSPEEAVQACFPECEAREHASGHLWVQYKLDEEIPAGWPEEEDVEGKASKVVDVEHLGTIEVLVPNDD